MLHYLITSPTFLHPLMLLSMHFLISVLRSSSGLRHTICKTAIRHRWVIAITSIIISRVSQRLLLDSNKSRQFAPAIGSVTARGEAGAEREGALVDYEVYV